MNKVNWWESWLIRKSFDENVNWWESQLMRKMIDEKVDWWSMKGLMMYVCTDGQC